MDFVYIKKYIYVLNMQELKKICSKLGINDNIYIETNNGIKKIYEHLHKEFIIDKIIKVLSGKKDKKIIYSIKMQKYTPTDNIKSTDYIYYGQYNTTDKNIKKILKTLTDGKFKCGAISQKIIKKHWAKNISLTYKEFAKKWLLEYNKGSINYDELAYNQFMKTNGNIKEWFEKKEKIVAKFKNMKLL